MPGACSLEEQQCRADLTPLKRGLPRWRYCSKEPACQCRRHKVEAGWNPGSGTSPAGGHGNPLQYSCLEYPMNRGDWRAMAHGVTKTWTWLKRWSMYALKLTGFRRALSFGLFTNLEEQTTYSRTVAPGQSYVS